jgi:hypothetical protein
MNFGEAGSAQTITDSSVEVLMRAILSTPAAIRPQLGNCEGVSVEFQPAMVRVKLGESADFTATATAEASIPVGKRQCTISLGNGADVPVSVTVAVPCPNPLASTTSTSPGSSTLLSVDAISAYGSFGNGCPTSVDSPSSTEGTTSLPTAAAAVVAEIVSSSVEPATTTTVAVDVQSRQRRSSRQRRCPQLLRLHRWPAKRPR